MTLSTLLPTITIPDDLRNVFQFRERTEHIRPYSSIGLGVTFEYPLIPFDESDVV